VGNISHIAIPVAKKEWNRRGSEPTGAVRWVCQLSCWLGVLTRLPRQTVLRRDG